MLQPVDDLRIARMETLSAPAQVIGESPATFAVTETVNAARQAVRRILDERDDRLVVIIGPCSIHDPAAAMEYARRLAREAGDPWYTAAFEQAAYACRVELDAERLEQVKRLL